MKKLALLSASIFLLGHAAGPASADDAEMIKNAEMAAPAAVAGAAQIVTVGADGKMKELRAGTNGYWCMADDPATPSNDPMCGDANAMEWLMAYIEKREPPKGKVGFGYMLMGGTAASNTDPYATAPSDGVWLEDGPHVMIFNAPDMNAAYPTGEKPDASQPYVMYPNTPYAHLMIPVK